MCIQTNVFTNLRCVYPLKKVIFEGVLLHILENYELVVTRFTYVLNFIYVDVEVQG